MQMNSQSCWPALCCAMVHVVVRRSPRSCESSSSDTCLFTSAPIGWNSCPNFLKQRLAKCSDSSFVESLWRQVKGATSSVTLEVQHSPNSPDGAKGIGMANAFIRRYQRNPFHQCGSPNDTIGGIIGIRRGE